MTPARPLAERQKYVIAFLAGILDANGRPVVPPQTYRMLMEPQPFIENGVVTPRIAPILQCKPIGEGKDELASTATVTQTAMLLEFGLKHSAWLDAFEALESMATPVPRTSVVMAFSYDTQSIAAEMDDIRERLIPDAWPEQQIIPTQYAASGPAAIAGLMGVVENA